MEIRKSFCTLNLFKIVEDDLGFAAWAVDFEHLLLRFLILSIGLF